MEARTGVPLADLAASRAGDRITFADAQVQPRTVITSPEWSGIEAHGRRYAPFTTNTEREKPWHTLSGRQHFYLDHAWMLELGEGLPVFRPPLHHRAIFGEQGAQDGSGRAELTLKYLTPHSKWSIHSEYQDNIHMLTLFRGGGMFWVSREDAEALEIKDNDWVEAYNRNGVVACRATVSHRIPQGTCLMYHAKDRHLNVPLTELQGKRGGTDNSLTRIVMKPTHFVGGYAQLSFRLQLLRADRLAARRGHRAAQASERGAFPVKVRSQVGMVMALDKCIGCHTCSVTCKQVWTNRPGAEYMWFNDVETKPGLGYPKRWEDQEKWRGGWELDRKGRLRLKAGGRLKKLASIFYNPELPEIDDYYEPWTYDYEKLITAPLSEHDPVARARSQITGREMEKIQWGPNWDDNLAGTAERIDEDPLTMGLQEKLRAEYEQAFMFYLPRICEHCLNPSCVASCPSGAMYKREEDGIVLVDQAKCRGWRFCVSGCPYKKVYFNHRTGKAEKCTLCYPRIEAGLPTICSETCVGRIRYLGIVLYDADRVEQAASSARPEAAARGPARGVPRPRGSRMSAVRRTATGSPTTGSTPRGARRCTRSRTATGSRCRLHPEYRTLPMVWYVPPLSPIVNALETDGYEADPDDVFPAIDAMRIPVDYLANLLSAGDSERDPRRAPAAGGDARPHAQARGPRRARRGDRRPPPG